MGRGEGRREGPQAGDQVSQSRQAGGRGVWVETDHWGVLGLEAAGSWKGRFCLGKWLFLSHVAPTRITMLIMAGMEGLDKDTQEGEKRNTTWKKKKKKKNPKLLRVPACLAERQAGYEQMF